MPPPPTAGPTAAHAPTSAIPLFHAAWLFAVGIAIAQFAWLRPALMLLALAPIAALCCVAAWRAQRLLWLPLAALWCLLGAWCAEMEPHPGPAPQLAALSDGLARTLDGTVMDAGPLRAETEANIDEPAEATLSQRVDVRVADLEFVDDSTDAQRPAGGAVRLTVHWPRNAKADALRCGERIRATVRLLPAEVYRDPGAWSRADYLLDQGITSTASVSAVSIARPGDGSGGRLACRIATLQHAASQRLLALPAAMRTLPPALRLSSDDAVMLAAMTTGDRTYLTHALRVGFERTGSFHMLVVSGLHLAIMAGCFFWIARRLRLPRVPATLVTIAASFAYALFTGFATPVQRSLWMVTLYLLGRLVYRERSALNTIGFAALCLLVVSPRSLLDAGLQMTLLAVISIAGVAAPLLESTVHPYLTATRDLRTVAIDVKLAPKYAQFRVILRMLAARLERAAFRGCGWRVLPWSVGCALRCVELLVVSCVVELAMTLPMGLYFHRITLFALPVNLLTVPLVALLLPAALLTLLTLAVWPAAAVVPGACTAAVLHLGVALVHGFGSLALGDLRVPAPLLAQSLAFCVLLAAAMMLARGGRWHRRAAWAALILAGCTVVVPRPIDRPRGALLVEALDVGQGDSLLVIAPDGTTMLVDGGGFGGGPRQAAQDFDIGEEIVSPALWSRGIRRLDVMALTHAHSDHMGGLPAVLRNFHPKELWVGNNPPVAAYVALLDEARGLNVQVRALHAGEALPLGNAAVRVLAPFADYKPGAEPSNDDSLVMRVAYGGTSAMLEGDAEAPVEQAMLAEPELASTLLKVGHHGSNTSTRPEFLARVSPQWAVISCGLRNRYGHPRAEVLERLEDAKVRTLSTDIDGASCFTLDGKSVTAEPLCGLRP
ncbi:MAG TPA: ComEC/Rec2 family competence protein [Terracidiphilus sp.]|jgi:competence protein ComEC|nr:ComEC/Rec2 family competence protein [Terracidiphilus sp.]